MEYESQADPPELVPHYFIVPVSIGCLLRESICDCSAALTIFTDPHTHAFAQVCTAASASTAALVFAGLGVVAGAVDGVTLAVRVGVVVAAAEADLTAAVAGGVDAAAADGEGRVGR